MGEKENRGKKNPDINLVLGEKFKLPCSDVQFFRTCAEPSPCHCKIVVAANTPKTQQQLAKKH